MREKEAEYDVGVVIGRFQVDRLHEGHIELLDEVFDRHDKVVVILGNSPILCSTRNPLDFDSRRRMIHEDYPDAIVVYQNDLPSDETWSKEVDAKIADLCPTQSVVLYGGRDSFVGRYSGRYDTRELEPTKFTSATEERKRLRRQVRNSADWRAGAIWTTGHRYPTCFPTVDVAILDEGRQRILLGRKKHEDRWRFIGGFVNPGEVWETAARREVKEETGLEITEPKYVGSYAVDDWRYRSEVDKITTSLFVANVRFGRPAPADDIQELRWFDFPVAAADLVPTHHPLMAMLNVHLINNG